MFDAPDHHGAQPGDVERYSFSSRITPQGVQGRSPGRFCASKPGVGGMKSVDVLGRIDGVHDLGTVETLGQRQLQQDAVDRARRDSAAR